MPGEEQEVRGVSRLSVVLMVVLESVVVVVVCGILVVVGVEGAVGFRLSKVWVSALGCDASVIFLASCGGVGLRKVSLLTEMKALPGVEKGRGP